MAGYIVCHVFTSWNFPSAPAHSLTKEVSFPTIGIGAGNACDGQILVWTDAFGMGAGKTPRFVRRYADLRGMLAEAARSYAADVHSSAFPNESESFSD